MNLHFVWYAKNWYKNSGDLMEDLKELIYRYSGVDKEYLTDRDVVSCVSHVWNDLKISEVDRGNLMHELYSPGPVGSYADNPIFQSGHIARACYLMLTHMMHIKATDMPEMPEKYDLDFSAQEKIDNSEKPV